MSAALALLPAAAAVTLLAELRRRRELAARAAHELRGPLTAARLALALAAREAGSPPAPAPGRAALEAADRELACAGDAVEDLERAARGRGPARRWAGVDVAALVEGQVQAWRPVALAAGRRLRAGGSLPRVVAPGDPRLLRRALANLVANALEHGAGEVTVSASRRGDRVRLEVRDGTPAAGPARAGVRPAGALADAARGGGRRHGHGLRVAATAAALHGGRLLLGRDAAGTVAILELPLAARSAGAARRGRDRPRRAPPPSPVAADGPGATPHAGRR